MLDDFKFFVTKERYERTLYVKSFQSKEPHNFQERFFCGLNLFFPKVRPQAMHPRPRMRSIVVMSLGVLNTYGSSAMAHKPTPISMKRCPTLSSTFSRYIDKNAAKIGRATNAARFPSIILAFCTT